MIRARAAEAVQAVTARVSPEPEAKKSSPKKTKEPSARRERRREKPAEASRSKTEERPAEKAEAKPEAAIPKPALAPTATEQPHSHASGPALGGEIERGPESSKRVALTFDAGSTNVPTPAILAALRTRGLRCTFFLTGRWAEQYPDTVRAIAAAGHELANHTYTHPDLTQLSDAAIADELRRTDEKVRALTGRNTRPYFRAPFGARNRRVLQAASAAGYRHVYWTVDSWDSVRKDITASAIRARVTSLTGPGHIVLLHCGSAATAEALPQLIRDLQSEGYQIVTVTQLLGSSPGSSRAAAGRTGISKG